MGQRDPEHDAFNEMASEHGGRVAYAVAGGTCDEQLERDDPVIHPVIVWNQHAGDLNDPENDLRALHVTEPEGGYIITLLFAQEDLEWLLANPRPPYEEE